MIPLVVLILLVGIVAIIVACSGANDGSDATSLGPPTLPDDRWAPRPCAICGVLESSRIVWPHMWCEEDQKLRCAVCYDRFDPYW